jgi:hypothetical protein
VGDEVTVDPVAHAATLPNFLVIGAMKAGTTTLHQYLDLHPEVFMPETKELHFFPVDKNWSRGLSWYESQFAGSAGAVARGEASPSYSQADQFPGVAARIATVLPDAKFVYVVREPIARMQSMYLHQCASGAETRPVDRALRENPIYINSSRYAWQVGQYLEFFAPDRFHVFTTEQLSTDPQVVLRRLFAFLGVDWTWVPPQTITAGRSDDRRAKPPALRRLAASRAYRAVVDRVPARARATARRVVTRPVDPGTARIDPRLYDELQDELRPDVARFRELFPATSLDAWGDAWS